MKFLSKLITIWLFTATSSTVFCKNMDIKHLRNTCYMEAAIHALSKVDEMNDKLRNCKDLTSESIPSLYIKLIDKIKDNWGKPDKSGKPQYVFMGSDEIEPGVTLENFYERLAIDCGYKYGVFGDSFQDAINRILIKINEKCPAATNDLTLDLVRKYKTSGTYALSRGYSVPLPFKCSIQSGFEDNFTQNSSLFRKIPKILMLFFNMPPENKSLADTITLKKEFIAPDMEFFSRDKKRMAKLDPETKKLKDLNCDLTYELFVIGTAQPDYHWWVYAKDSGPNGQWYKYDNFRDNNGEVKHFSNLKEIEADFEANHYPMYFFYRRKITIQEQLAQLKVSLQELKTKLQILQEKLEKLREKL